MKHNALMLFIMLCSVISMSARASSGETNMEVLKRVWKLGSEKFCAKDKQALFNHRSFDSILKNLKSQSDRTELAIALNPFLFSLGYSHTEFMPDSSEGYYLFKSYVAMETSKAVSAPKLISPGVQLGKDEKGYFIREVLDGFPAKNAGLKKLDRLVSLDEKPFSGIWGNRPTSILLGIERQGKLKTISLDVQALDWNATFQEATSHSVRIFERPNKKKIGYVHLWSGVHPDSASLLQKIVTDFKNDHVDGIVLDLRGGYGGAWWDHLDPFFADTGSYMEMEVQKPDGKTETLKSPFKKNANAYLGPMVVLVDQGVRSGKEAMAYQFKKTKRAHLIGQKTPGYFSTGQYFFADEPKNYILYLCVFKAQLDGVQIEGVGIEPDEVVPFNSVDELGDSQLQAGLNFFTK